MKIEDKKILVIYGGFSLEREISIKTGKAIIEELQRNRINVIPFELTKDNLMELKKIEFDLAFIALHGKYGEDGKIQSFFELLNKKYCGSNVLSSALCMNKYFTKKFFVSSGLPTPEFEIIEKGESIDSLKYPVVIKALDQGSSIGLYIVNNKNEMIECSTKIFDICDKILVEKYIEGPEFTVPVITKNGVNISLPIIQIKSKNKFFDFEAKYVKGKTEYIVPAEIDKALENKLKDYALKTFELLECKDFARIDFILDREEKVNIIEVNTIPGMTETSLLPMSAKAEGIDFSELLKIIIKNNL